jgi:phage-related protein
MADINISVSVADGSKLPTYRVGVPLNKADLYKEIQLNTLYTNVKIYNGYTLAVKFYIPEDVILVDINFPRVEQYKVFMWASLWIATQPDDMGMLPWNYARYIPAVGDTIDVITPGWWWLLVDYDYPAAYAQEEKYLLIDFEILAYTSKQEKEISDDIKNTGNEIKNQNNQAGNDIQNNVNTATDDILRYLTNLGNTVSSLMSGVGEVLGKGFEALGTAITNIISSVTSAITNALSYVGELIYKAVESIISFFGDLLTRLFDSLVSVLNSIYTTIRDFLERIWKFIEEVVLKAIAEFVKWFIETVESMPGRIADAFSSIIFEEVEE